MVNPRRFSEADLIAEPASGAGIKNCPRRPQTSRIFRYEITQTLFIGEHTLLVEGPPDLLYLKTFSNALQRRGRTALDSRCVVCPCGGIDKVPAFVSLFGGNRLYVAMLTDVAKGTKSKLDNFRRSEMLMEGHILSAAEFCKQNEADVEDLIGIDLYVEVVNRAFNLPAERQLSPGIAKANSSNTERLLQGVEAVFRMMPPSIPDFDHYQPARWLASNDSILSQGGIEVELSLERFECLFAALNRLLSQVADSGSATRTNAQGAQWLKGEDSIR
jgi:hypothetical protein